MPSSEPLGPPLPGSAEWTTQSFTPGPALKCPGSEAKLGATTLSLVADQCFILSRPQVETWMGSSVLATAMPQ